MKQKCIALLLCAAAVCLLVCTGSLADDSNPLQVSMSIDQQEFTGPAQARVTIELSNTGARTLPGPVTLYGPDGNQIEAFGAPVLEAGTSQSWSGTVDVTQEMLETGRLSLKVRYFRYNEANEAVSKTRVVSKNIRYSPGNAAWDCPNCGKKGNTRNFCGICGYQRVQNPDTKVMSHAEFLAASLGEKVIIESYVQDHETWWDNKIVVYLQDMDGAYCVYNMACSEEDAAKLLPGTKIRVEGIKAEWSGEIEIIEGTFRFAGGESFIAKATDVTALFGSDELQAHMNERISVKDAIVVPQPDGAGFAYKNPDQKTDDLYFDIMVGTQIVHCCVEFYLRGQDSEVYQTVERLKAGDVIDLEGFLYWYVDPLIQTVSMKIKSQ